MRAGSWIAVVLVAGCLGKGPPIAIVNPDYVVLRSVSTAPRPGAIAASAFGETVYFQPSDRLMDLRHFDPRTAKVEDRTASGGSYVVGLGTTPDGNRLLHAWTSTHLRKKLGIFVDGRLVLAPIVLAPVEDRIVIDGNFTKAQAEAIVGRLEKGGAP